MSYVLKLDSEKLTIGEHGINSWVQSDGSIVDLNWNVIPSDRREKINKNRESLPIYSRIDDIIHAFNNHIVTIIRAETWSGKSTQLPGIIYDNLLHNQITDPYINLIQPRVAASTWLARWVSTERLCQTWNPIWTVGNRIWFRTGRWTLSSHNTRVSYNTSWHELMRVIHSWIYPDVIILDEFHTKDIQLMALDYIIRTELEKNNKKLKVIIASATLDPQPILDTYSSISKDIPVIDVEWRTYPMEKIFLKSEDFDDTVKRLYEEWKNVAIFEEWKWEIAKTIRKINNITQGKSVIFPFHWDMTIEEQREIIDYKPKKWTPVFIVWTNAMEESLTVAYLHAVIDKWYHKVASVNSVWVSRLDPKPVSKANFKQRAWRACRTWPWEWIRTCDVPYDGLDEYPTPPIANMTLEREILSLYAMWINIPEELVKCHAEWKKMFVDEPSGELVFLSLERLYKLWAIDEGGITKLWKRILSIPLSVFNAMIVIEWMKRGVSKDMVEIAAIMEEKWFLVWELNWKNMYKFKENSNDSDLFLQLDIFRKLTSTHLSESELDFFSEKWGFWDYWRAEFGMWEKMLYELIDESILAKIWISKKSLDRIYDTILDIKKKLSEENHVLSNSWTIDDKILSILSWNLHNIFSYSKNKKTYQNAFYDWWIDFKLWKISSVLPDKEWWEWIFYIWSPFIVWKKSHWKDNCTLSLLTIIWEEHISHFKDIIEENNPDWLEKYRVLRKMLWKKARHTKAVEEKAEKKNNVPYFVLWQNPSWLWRVSNKRKKKKPFYRRERTVKSSILELNKKRSKTLRQREYAEVPVISSKTSNKKPVIIVPENIKDLRQRNRKLIDEYIAINIDFLTNDFSTELDKFLEEEFISRAWKLSWTEFPNFLSKINSLSDWQKEIFFEYIKKESVKDDSIRNAVWSLRNRITSIKEIFNEISEFRDDEGDYLLWAIEFIESEIKQKSIELKKLNDEYIRILKENNADNKWNVNKIKTILDRFDEQHSIDFLKLKLKTLDLSKEMDVAKHEEISSKLSKLKTERGDLEKKYNEKLDRESKLEKWREKISELNNSIESRRQDLVWLKLNLRRFNRKVHLREAKERNFKSCFHSKYHERVDSILKALWWWSDEKLLLELKELSQNSISDLEDEIENNIWSIGKHSSISLKKRKVNFSWRGLYEELYINDSLDIKALRQLLKNEKENIFSDEDRETLEENIEWLNSKGKWKGRKRNRHLKNLDRFLREKFSQNEDLWVDIKIDLEEINSFSLDFLSKIFTKEYYENVIEKSFNISAFLSSGKSLADYVKRNYSLENLKWISEWISEYKFLLEEIEKLQVSLQKLENESSKLENEDELEHIETKLKKIISLTVEKINSDESYSKVKHMLFKLFYIYKRNEI